MKLCHNKFELSDSAERTLVVISWLNPPARDWSTGSKPNGTALDNKYRLISKRKIAQFGLLHLVST